MRVFTEDDDSEDGHPGVLEQGVVGEAVGEGGHVEEGVQDPASGRIEDTPRSSGSGGVLGPPNRPGKSPKTSANCNFVKFLKTNKYVEIK